MRLVNVINSCLFGFLESVYMNRLVTRSFMFVLEVVRTRLARNCAASM